MIAIKARFVALLSLFAILSCAAAPVFAQSLVDPANAQPDIVALLQGLFNAVGDFRTGAILLGLSLLGNGLTNLTKIPAISSGIPPAARPLIALALSLTVSLTGAAIGHAPFAAAIVAGVAGGGGSIALHEAWQTIKTGWAALVLFMRSRAAKGLAVRGVVFALAIGSVCGCAFLHRLGRASEICLSDAKSDLVAALSDVLMNYPDEQWVSVAEHLAPDAKCEMQAIASSLATPQEFRAAPAEMMLGKSNSLGGSNAKWIVEQPEAPGARAHRRACGYLLNRYGGAALPASCAR